MVFKKALLLVMFLSFVSCASCFAQEYVSKDKYEQLERRVQALEQKLAEQDKCIKDQKEGSPVSIANGLEVGAGATMIVQGTNNTNAGDNSKKDSRADASYSADITIGRDFKGINGKAFVHLEAGTGAGLEDDLSLYSNVNRDADNDNNVRITELWYEQGLFKDKTLLTFGKLDPTVYFDNNEVANDETTQFLGRIFRNSPTIEFPDNTVGIRLTVIPKDWLELRYGVFDGNSDWEKIGDNLFNIGQVTFKTKFFGLDGNCRFLGWNSNVYNTKWLATEENKESTYGFGLSFDQKVNGIITLFTRYGWQNPEVYNPDIKATGDLNFSLEHSWSAGFQVVGKPWDRENDVLGFAVGQAIPSGDYKKAGAEFDPVRRAKSEDHFEAYYNIHINDYLSLSPDFQYVWNPFGKDIADDTSSIFIYGLRTQIDF